MLRSPVGLAALGAAVVIFIMCVAGDARGWNPLRSGGRSLGKGFGEGFVETAATPLLRNVEETGKRFVREVNTHLADRIAQAGSEIGAALDKADSVVGTADAAVAARMAQADAMMAARIAQIDVGANRLVAGALGRLDGSIENAQRAGLGLIRALSGERQRALAQADAVMTARIDQIGDLLGRSLEDVDAVLEARFAQIDEAAGRRLANLDAIATKQSHALEQSLLRIGALAALLLFVLFVLKRLYEDFDRLWDRRVASDPGRKRVRMVAIGKTGGLFLLRVAAGGIGALVIYGLYLKLPLGAEHRAAELLERNRRAFEVSQRSLDFAGVRHYASQLILLEADPEKQARYRATERKFDVLRSVLSRPALLRDPGGIRSVMDQIAALEEMLGRDVDLDVLKAYISWHAGGSRDDEREAAELCARALSSGHGDFVLRPLAREYLVAFLHNPPPGESPDAMALAEMRKIAQAAQADGKGSAFAHVIAYDELVRELDARSWAAYLGMLDAHAAYVAARAALPRRAPAGSPQAEAVRKAKQQRLDRAVEVVEAWRAFDEGLRTHPALVGTNVGYAAFTLNDVPLVHALWFEASPDAARLPATVASIGDMSLRARVVPLRVEWARRYGLPLDRPARYLLALEETQRYRSFEEKTYAFATAYIAHRAARGGEIAAASDGQIALARAAAELAVYVAPSGAERQPLGIVLLGASTSAERATIEELYRRRQPLFL